MRIPKCPGIPERVGVEVIDEHQFAARIADDLSRNGSDRSPNLVGSAALPVPLERPTRWGEGPAVRIRFPPAASLSHWCLPRLQAQKDRVSPRMLAWTRPENGTCRPPTCWPSPFFSDGH